MKDELNENKYFFPINMHIMFFDDFCVKKIEKIGDGTLILSSLCTTYTAMSGERLFLVNSSEIQKRYGFVKSITFPWREYVFIKIDLQKTM